MKKAGLFLLASIITQTSFSAKLTGHIAPAKEWANTVYLTEVTDYKYFRSGSSDVVIDSQQLNAKGNFKFEHLKANTIYKVSVRPEGQPAGALIQDGSQDNYAFAVLGDQASTVAINAEMSKLFLSYSINSSNADLAALNNKILYLRNLQLPLYKKMQSLDGSPLKTLQDPDKIAEYQLGLVREIKAATESSNKLMLPFLLKETNPNLLSIGSALYQVEFASHKDNDQITAHFKEVIQKTPSPILNTVLNVLVKSREEIKPDFMFDKDYALMEGRNFSFLSPRIPAKFILLDFWASWCTPCRKSIKTELPYLSKKYAAEQLKIVGVVVRDKFQTAEKAIKADKNKHPQIYDHDGALNKYFEIGAIPYYVLINQETQEVKGFHAFVEVQEYLAREIKE